MIFFRLLGFRLSIFGLAGWVLNWLLGFPSVHNPCARIANTFSVTIDPNWSSGSQNNIQEKELFPSTFSRWQQFDPKTDVLCKVTQRWPHGWRLDKVPTEYKLICSYCGGKIAFRALICDSHEVTTCKLILPQGPCLEGSSGYCLFRRVNIAHDHCLDEAWELTDFSIVIVTKETLVRRWHPVISRCTHEQSCWRTCKTNWFEPVRCGFMMSSRNVELWITEVKPPFSVWGLLHGWVANTNTCFSWLLKWIINPHHRFLVTQSRKCKFLTHLAKNTVCHLKWLPQIFPWEEKITFKKDHIRKRLGGPGWLMNPPTSWRRTLVSASPEDTSNHSRPIYSNTSSDQSLVNLLQTASKDNTAGDHARASLECNLQAERESRSRIRSECQHMDYFGEKRCFQLWKTG